MEVSCSISAVHSIDYFDASSRWICVPWSILAPVSCWFCNGLSVSVYISHQSYHAVHTHCLDPRGFQSTVRANTLAQKIIAADIAYGLNDQYTFYTADNCTTVASQVARFLLTTILSRLSERHPNVAERQLYQSRLAFLY